MTNSAGLNTENVSVHHSSRFFFSPPLHIFNSVLVGGVTEVWDASLITFCLSAGSNWHWGLIYGIAEDKQQRQQLCVLEEKFLLQIISTEVTVESRTGAVGVGKQWLQCSDETISGTVLQREETEGKRRRLVSVSQLSSPEAAEVSIRLTFVSQEVKDQWSMRLFSSWPGVRP